MPCYPAFSETVNKNAVIAAGQSLSAAIDIEKFRLAGIITPSNLHTATSLTFQVSDRIDGTFNNLYDDDGNEITITVAVSRGVGIDTNAGALAPWQYIKVRTGAAATPVVQTGGATLILALKA